MCRISPINTIERRPAYSFYTNIVRRFYRQLARFKVILYDGHYARFGVSRVREESSECSDFGMQTLFWKSEEKKKKKSGR